MISHGPCARCSKEIIQEEGAGGTGYVERDNGFKICYACCGELDLLAMRENGVAWGYLSGFLEGRMRLYGDPLLTFSNWPGSLKINVPFATQKKMYAFGSSYPRVDFWFRPQYADGTLDPFIWHGVSMGNWQTTAKVKRTKKTKF